MSTSGVPKAEVKVCENSTHSIAVTPLAWPITACNQLAGLGEGGQRALRSDIELCP